MSAHITLVGIPTEGEINKYAQISVWKNGIGLRF